MPRIRPAAAREARARQAHPTGVRGAPAAVLPRTSRNARSLQARGHRLAEARAGSARASDILADLEHGDSKRRLRHRLRSKPSLVPSTSPCCARREMDAAEERRHKEVCRSSCLPTASSLSPSRRMPRPKTPSGDGWRSGMASASTAFSHSACSRRLGAQVSSGRTRRDLQPGDAGGRAPHLVFRQLGGLASTQPALVAAAVV